MNVTSSTRRGTTGIAIVIALTFGCLAATAARAATTTPGFGSARAAAATPVDGVWRMTTKFGDNPDDPDVVAENYGSWIFVFDRGRFAFTQSYKNACTWGYGKFTVKRNTMAWVFTDGGGIAPNHAENRPGEFFRFGWSRSRATLTVTAVKGSISPETFRAKPWHLVSRTPSRRYLSKRCPPPAAALPR